MDKRFFYIAAGPITPLGQVVKVGITDSPETRASALRSSKLELDIWAAWQFYDPDFAHALECRMIYEYRGHVFRQGGKRVGAEYFWGKWKNFVPVVNAFIKESGVAHTRYPI